MVGPTGPENNLTRQIKEAEIKRKFIRKTFVGGICHESFANFACPKHLLNVKCSKISMYCFCPLLFKTQKRCDDITENLEPAKQH